MPELVEVETIKHVLEPQLRGEKIVKLSVFRPEVIAHPDAEAFEKCVSGERITKMRRRGKYLMMELENQCTVAIHLRMTGQLLVTPVSYPARKHTHVIFHLENGQELRFIDTRRFGKLWLWRQGERDTFTGMASLGPEPLDTSLTGAYLSESAGNSRRSVKTCLLDQTLVAGIGNIYSDEILFAAGIHPQRPAESLCQEEWERLAEIIPQTMAYFLEKNVISPEDYLLTEGKEYRNTPYLRVYGHQGEPCPNCAATLQRTVICGRSSVYCPCCQKEH